MNKDRMQKKRITIRFDERMRMLLGELSEMTGASVSAIIRHLVGRGLDGLLDKGGNWKKRDDKEKDKSRVNEGAG